MGLPGVMTKFMQLTVVFASLMTSVALVSVGPHGHGAHAKTTNMTRDLTLERHADQACQWTVHPDTYLSGTPSGWSGLYSLDEAKQHCLEVDACSGVTCASWPGHPKPCTLRELAGLRTSRSGETTYIAGAGCTAGVNTPSLSAAVVQSGAVAAVGDPHMQNILGQRFDLAQPGEHTLLEIPRGASASDALLRVTADAEHEGGACSDMYFKALNITGLWVSAQQKDGYMYTAGAPQPVAGWRTFGKVEVKVAWGRTLGGVEYLNFMVRHLTRVGQDVGGLLGMDDYTQAAKRDPSCGSAILVQLSSASQEASFALADM